ncbi:hypothetical protein F3K40_06875 [Streptomyces sp. LBUM 1478]|uniref:DUF6338 family protein n=2 Tax=Streptomyces scabiei TaxID=1930 RepID=UPI0004E6ED66|nr:MULTISPECIES: DUF6338 family protein [Streptomyces]MBP5866963.1 hypothetical protein [Streptomyces sp. LBUM 1485]MBP5905593.1 hypothetical protein [Streptomyces sp. LBUM 1478]MBP5931997.1 hypothetical protein [Streptomyces sp. LBUM 1479]KFG05397.1 hypothetical protein IQ61_30365 [Streptomyces scabiei]MBP5894067.1 hypothetical protein [Streptomyces sp. LBUM 1481]
MPHTPTTVTQVVIVLLLVLPGAIYQFVRERARGLAPGHKDLGERVLRAVTAGVVLDTLYILLAGPWLVRLVYDRRRGWLTGAAENPRITALTAAALLIVVPAIAAWLPSWWRSRGSRSAYDPVPTAWDKLFQSRGHCLVRARLKSGGFVGGYYGEESYTSSYPEAADLYLQSAWALSASGVFERPLEHSGGIYIRMDDVEVLDFVEVSPATESAPAGGNGDTTGDRDTTAVRPEREEGVPARRPTPRADAGPAHTSPTHTSPDH